MCSGMLLLSVDLPGLHCWMRHHSSEEPSSKLGRLDTLLVLWTCAFDLEQSLCGWIVPEHHLSSLLERHKQNVNLNQRRNELRPLPLFIFRTIHLFLSSSSPPQLPFLISPLSRSLSIPFILLMGYVPPFFTALQLLLHFYCVCFLFLTPKHWNKCIKDQDLTLRPNSKKKKRNQKKPIHIKI